MKKQEIISCFFYTKGEMNNDYGDAVIEYYEDEIADILNRDNVLKYNTNASVTISFAPGTDVVDSRSKYTLFKIYDFSGNNKSQLTYEEVLEGLKEYKPVS